MAKYKAAVEVLVAHADQDVDNSVGTPCEITMDTGSIVFESDEDLIQFMLDAFITNYQMRLSPEDRYAIFKETKYIYVTEVTKPPTLIDEVASPSEKAEKLARAIMSGNLMEKNQ